MGNNRRSRVIKTQLIKYTIVILVAIASISGYKLFTSLPKTILITTFITTIGLLMIMLIADIISAKDLLPFLKG